MRSQIIADGVFNNPALGYVLVILSLIIAVTYGYTARKNNKRK